MIHPYLSFCGNCREAINFYHQAFETDPPRLMTFGDSPAAEDLPLTDADKNRVMHGEIVIAGSRIMVSDAAKDANITPGNNISFALTASDEEKLRNWFSALSQGGKVEMEPVETPWSRFYGIVTDKFGIRWQFSHVDEQS